MIAKGSWRWRPRRRRLFASRSGDGDPIAAHARVRGTSVDANSAGEHPETGAAIHDLRVEEGTRVTRRCGEAGKLQERNPGDRAPGHGWRGDRDGGGAPSRDTRDVKVSGRTRGPKGIGEPFLLGAIGLL